VALTGADDADQQPREGALVLCIDASAFRPARRVADSVVLMQVRIRNSGSEGQILAPGDPEELSRAAAAGSIWVDPALVAQLRQLAQIPHQP